MSHYEQTVLEDVETRKRQKVQLQELNDRLAQFLKELLRLDWSNQNLDSVKAQWRKNIELIIQLYKDDCTESERILITYQREKSDLERQIDAIRNELADIQRRIKDATQGRADYEQQLNNLLKKLYELEAEEKLLEHRRAFLEEEIVALQSQNKRLNAEIERTLHGIAEQEDRFRTNKGKLDGFERELQRMKEEHEKIMGEQPRKGDGTFTDDVDKAIAEIRTEFEKLISNRGDDLKSMYRSQIQKQIKVPVSDADLEEQRRINRQLEEIRVQIRDRFALNNALRNEIFDIKLAFEKEKQTYEIKTRHTRSRIDEQAKEIRDIQEKIEELKKRNAALQAEIQTYRRLLESDKAMRKLELARAQF